MRRPIRQSAATLEVVVGEWRGSLTPIRQGRLLVGGWNVDRANHTGMVGGVPRDFFFPSLTGYSQPVYAT